MKLTAGILFAIVFIPHVLLADDPGPEMKWGDVPMDQLKMTSFPSDTNATAVILFDLGDVKFGSNFDLVYTHHRRIKILSKAGFDWGTHTIPYYKKDGTQRVTDIEGQTITLNENGKVVTTEMDDDAVFDEETAENWHRKKFTLPALTPGCVIEYRYCVKSTNPWYMPDWYFQNSEPVLWSEFRYKTPAIFIYSGASNGYLNFFVESNEIVRETYMMPSGPQIIQVNSARYVIKDGPALREEPYLTTINDYRQHIALQLAEVNWPGELSRKILQSWEKVATEVMDHDKFGAQLKGFSAERRQTEAVVKDISDPVKKMEAVYDFVRKTVVWNGLERVIATNDLDDVFESKTGNSAEINLLLMLMLREAGLEVSPVLLSTRENGKIQRLYPLIDQFNYVIARVVIGKNAYLLDATDRYRPYKLLPFRALNHTGFLVLKANYEWLDIGPGGKGKEATVVNATLSPDGSMRATAEMAFFDYSDSYQRDVHAKKKEKDYMKDLLRTETAGIVADSFQVDKSDSAGAGFRVWAKVSSPSYAQVLNDFIYCNPFVVGRARQNPFKREKREFPIDYGYPVSTTYTTNITFPEGYVLKEPPHTVKASLPGNGGSYSRISDTTSNGLKVVERFDINQITFSPREYAALKGLYDRVVAAENEQFVLEKKPAPAPPPAPEAKPAKQPSGTKGKK